MPTSRRLTRKKRSQRRLTRRQRGGATIDIVVSDYQLGPIGFKQLTIEENSSIRSVLKQWIQQSTKLQAAAIPAFLRYADKRPVPNFQFFNETGKLLDPVNWDEPYPFKNRQTYKFMYLIKQQAQNDDKAKFKGTIEYALNAIVYYATKRTPAKIIRQSHSTSNHLNAIARNVNQTFKFSAEPKTPIILMDKAWFDGENHEAWQFYNLLEFEERVEPAVGPKEFVRFYTKPAGRPFTIKGPTNGYKEAYLAEVQRQAATGSFDIMSEIEICCVKHFDDKENRGLEERIINVSERTGSLMYTFAAVSEPDYIESMGGQSGGKQIFIRRNNGKKTIVLNIANNATPHDVLMAYANKNIATEAGSRNFMNMMERTPPLISLRQGSRTLPITNLKEPFNFQKEATYNIFIQKSKWAHLQEAKTSKESFGVLKKVINYLNATYGAAKIITESAAVTDVIDKNVKQQFMFYNDPLTPILLVDSGFFGTYDFYKYLNFQEFTVPDIGPNSIVKFFKKPAGIKLNITNNYPEIPKIDKARYYKEVLTQARGRFDINNEEMIIVCLKHHFSEETNTDSSDLKEYVAKLNNPEIKVYVWSA